MDLDFAVLADGVVARPDGKLDILGAGFDTTADLTILAKLACALSRARAVPLAA